MKKHNLMTSYIVLALGKQQMLKLRLKWPMFKVWKVDYELNLKKIIFGLKMVTEKMFFVKFFSTNVKSIR